jgi:leucyl aminopeptidase
MTTPATLAFVETDLDRLAGTEGRIAVIVPPSGKLDQAGRRLNRLMRGALERFADGEDFAKMKEGEARDLAYPSGWRPRRCRW